MRAVRAKPVAQQSHRSGIRVAYGAVGLMEGEEESTENGGGLIRSFEEQEVARFLDQAERGVWDASGNAPSGGERNQPVLRAVHD